MDTVFAVIMVIFIHIIYIKIFNQQTTYNKGFVDFFLQKVFPMFKRIFANTRISCYLIYLLILRGFLASLKHRVGNTPIPNFFLTYRLKIILNIIQLFRLFNFFLVIFSFPNGIEIDDKIS